MRFSGEQFIPPLRLGALEGKKKKISILCRRFGIELLFVHGSLAKDKHRPLSDVDLAVFCRNMDLKKFLKIRDALADLFHREDIDLGDLIQSSPLFCMQVVANGIPLHIKNKAILTRFRYNTIRRYLDTRHLYDQFEKFFVQAVL